MPPFGMEKPLLLGTTNMGKVRELQRCAAQRGIATVAWGDPLLQSRGAPPRVAETSTSYSENASLKARAYATWADLPCIADDTGIEVDVLRGFPGIFTAQWGLTRVAEAMTPFTSSSARFVCALAYADGGGRLVVVQTSIPGRFLSPPHAANQANNTLPFSDFFYPDGQTLPLSLIAREGMVISHRAKAFDLLLATLR